MLIVPKTRVEAPAGVPAEDTPSALEGTRALTRELCELMHDQLQLAALEARLAAHSAMTMVAAAVGLGVLLVTVWLGLMGAAVSVLVSAGLAPSLALLGIAVLNLLVSPILYGLIRRQSRNLGFPATLRTLKPAPTRDGATGA